MLLLLSLSGCQQEVNTHSKQVKFQTVTTDTLVPSLSYQDTLQFTGTIRAGNTTGIGFELAGKLKSITADSGDRVEKANYWHN